MSTPLSPNLACITPVFSFPFPHAFYYLSWYIYASPRDIESSTLNSQTIQHVTHITNTLDFKSQISTDISSLMCLFRTGSLAQSSRIRILRNRMRKPTRILSLSLSPVSPLNDHWHNHRVKEIMENSKSRKYASRLILTPKLPWSTGRRSLEPSRL